MKVLSIIKKILPLLLSLFLYVNLSAQSNRATISSLAPQVDSINSTCDSVYIWAFVQYDNLVLGSHSLNCRIYWGDGTNTLYSSTFVAGFTTTSSNQFFPMQHMYTTPGLYMPYIIANVDGGFTAADTSYFTVANTMERVTLCPGTSISIDSAYDSLTYNACGPSIVRFRVEGTAHYLATSISNVHIVVDYGDGDSSIINTYLSGSYSSSTYAYTFSHYYSSPGTYDVSYTVSYGATSDYEMHYAEVTILSCNNLQGNVFSDCNSNCVHDSSEIGVSGVSLLLIHGSSIDTISTDSIGNYYFADSLNFDTAYTLVLNNLSTLGYSPACSSNDTINFTAAGVGYTNIHNFVLSCIPPTITINSARDTTTSVACDTSNVNFTITGNTSNINASSTVYLRVDFGDGTNSTYPITLTGSNSAATFNRTISHVYTSAGTYNVSYIVFNGTASDSIYHSAEVVVSACNRITGQVFSDCNTNCLRDIGENYIAGVNVRIFQGSTVVYNGFTNSLGQYSFLYTPGLAYNVVLSNLTALGYTATCPATGSTSITPTSGNYTLNFALNCNAPDITITSAEDTFRVYNCGTDYARFVIRGVVNNIATSSPLSIKIYFGDGTTYSSTSLSHPGTFSSSTFYFNYYKTYTTPGTYHVSYVIWNGVTKDSVYHAAEVIIHPCTTLSGYAYFDCNNNCIHDSTESGPIDSLYVIAYNGLTAVAYGQVDYNTGLFSLNLDTGINYTIVLDTSNASQLFSPTCASAFSQNILLTSTTNAPIYFPLVCSRSINIDWTRHGYNNTELCAPRMDTLYVNSSYHNYNAGDTVHVRAYYGDGSYDEHIHICPNPATAAIFYFYDNFPHSYSTAGTYTYSYEVFTNSGLGDTLTFTNGVTLADSCGNITGLLYNDRDSNCSFSAGDLILANQLVILKQGLTVIAYDYTDAMGAYYFTVPVGPTYTVSVPTLTSTSLAVRCPSSTGSVTFASTGFDIYDFGYRSVAPVSSFDLVAYNYNITTLRPGQLSTLSVYARELMASAPTKSCVLTLTFDSRLTYAGPGHYLGTGIAPTSVVGNVVTWNISAINYSMYNVIREILLRVDSTAVITDVYCFTVSVTPTIGDIFIPNNTNTKCAHVFSGFDPNYKTVSPAGEGALGKVLPNQWLEYTVHFENTGNDTAFNIHVQDQIDPNLDIETFELISSSHPASVYYLPSRIMKIDFPHINLPDTGTDKAHASGEFTYRIKMKADLANGTQIENNAAIYFDINPPVITNTTLNTIDKTLGLPDVSNLEFAIYPNPANEFARIEFNDINNISAINIYNVLGTLVQSQLVESNSLSIATSNLSSGMYLIKVVDKNNNLLNDAKRLIVVH